MEVLKPSEGQTFPEGNEKNRTQKGFKQESYNAQMC